MAKFLTMRTELDQPKDSQFRLAPMKASLPVQIDKNGDRICNQCQLPKNAKDDFYNGAICKTCTLANKKKAREEKLLADKMFI